MNAPPIALPKERNAAHEQMLAKEEVWIRPRDTLTVERRRMPTSRA
ncbi:MULTISPECIES: hypothetical protein [unclassified Rhodanobacter]|nr:MULTISPECIES: hypothetical protein [unclassified Rhodanobacter]MBT2144713.1 hypothetical protein [Rhodanobacter sp. LX-99]MBT2148758.1 hypothetical protein [Rhodanobacter sp. LX-100]